MKCIFYGSCSISFIIKNNHIKTITFENYHRSQTFMNHELLHCSFHMFLYQRPPTASLRNKITYPIIFSIQFIFHNSVQVCKFDYLLIMYKSSFSAFDVYASGKLYTLYIYIFPGLSNTKMHYSWQNMARLTLIHSFIIVL